MVKTSNLGTKGAGNEHIDKTIAFTSKPPNLPTLIVLLNPPLLRSDKTTFLQPSPPKTYLGREVQSRPARSSRLQTAKLD